MESKNEEEWLPVTGYEGIYEVSSFGRVQSLDREDCKGRRLKGRVLSPGTSGGYPFVQLSDNGEKWVVRVHTLVADAFLGERPEGYEVNHIDGDFMNNAVSNLRYMTHRDVIRHATSIGKLGKLSPEQVRDIRVAFESNPFMKATDYSREKDVPANLVREVIAARSFTSVTGNDGKPGGRVRDKYGLDGHVVAKMRYEGLSMQEIANHFGREVSGVYRSYYRVSRHAA